MNRRIVILLLAVTALLTVIEPRVTANQCSGTGDQAGPFCIDGVIPDADVATTTTLTGAVNNAATTFAVTSTTGFVAGDFALVDQEKVLVKSVTNATSMVVVRAQLATTAAGHSLGARITDLKPINNDPSFGSDELGPKNGNLTKLNVINSDCTPGTTSKTCLEFTNPNANQDLNSVWLKGGTDANDDLWIYFAWSRDANTGSGLIGVELHRLAADAACDYENKTAAQLITDCNPFKSRRNGDILLLWDQQGGANQIYIRTFVENAGNNPTHKGAFGPPVSLTAADSPFLGSAFAAYGNGNFRGEMAINLSDVVPPTGQACESFANVVPGTVTGNSDQADYKDLVLKKFPLISNCGGVKIIKDTDPEDGTGTFEYTLTGPSTIFPGAVDAACADSSDHTQCVGTLVNDGDFDEIANLLNGTYALTESDMPSNYDLDSISCVITGDANSPYTGASFPVQTGKQTVCTITNKLKTGTYRVVKEITNGFGITATCPNFQFKVDSGSFQAWDSTCQTDFTFGVGTQHSAVEDTTSLPSGFAFDSASANCTNGTIVANSVVTCTIKNKALIANPLLATAQKIVLHDRAKITGIRRGANDTNGGAQQATVTFTLFEGSSCNTQVGSPQTVQVNFGAADTTSTQITVGTSTGFEIFFTGAGVSGTPKTWSWKAVYNGNQYNAPTASDATACNEAIVVNISGNAAIPQ